MKKLIPLIFSIFFFIVIICLWDFIKLPYDNDNLVIGEYFYKKINPLNDIIRFLFIIGIPILIYLIFYLRLNKQTYSLKKNENFFLFKNHIVKTCSLNTLAFLFSAIIVLEFLSLDFQIFIQNIDVFHEGTFLVPPMNYLKTNEFFTSTLYDYGFIANNIGYFYYKLFGYYNPGSIIFTKLILILLIKLILILISVKLINYLLIDKFFKKIFFIIFTFILINFPDYYDHNSYFSPRAFLYIFFIYFLLNEIEKVKDCNFNYILVGSFSFISIMWWWDIGAYLNALLIFLLVYFLYDRQHKNFLLVLIGILTPWVIFYYFILDQNFDEFIFQLKFPLSQQWDYLLGIEYKKPFSENSGRWTRAILLIYFSSILLINFNFSKNYKVNFIAKIFINLIFILSLLIFKSALMRSDVYHLKYVSGVYTLVFVYLILFNLFYFVNKNEKLKKFFLIKIKKKTITFIVIFIFIFFNQIYKNDKSNTLHKQFTNFVYFKKNIYSLIKANQNAFISQNTSDVIKYYKNISTEDTCAQIMTDDISFSYFLEKKTCTQFFIPGQIINGFTEKYFIDQLKKNSPNIILFESNLKLLANKKNMPNAINYINNNYSFYENYKGYIFYKKNNLFFSN